VSFKGSSGERVLAFLLLLAHALLALAGIWIHSLTFDERTHLPAGMATAASGEIWLNRQHPPLLKVLAGLAANTTGPTLPLEGAAYREGREWDFGSEVLFSPANDHWAMLRRGRLPTLMISLLGGLFVYLWSRQLFGAAGALFSLALWAFSPTLLGHDGWVTMDAPLAALGVGAFFATWRLDVASREGGRAGGAGGGAGGGSPAAWRAALWAGLPLGLALAVKFSALVFAAAIVPLALLHGPWRERLWRLLPLGFGAALVLWACYLFPRDPLFYLEGLGRLYRDVKPDYLFYLAGEFSRRFPHYFLATFALKSTPVELLLVPLTAAAALASPRRRELLLFLAAPALLFFLATSVLATNQGHRYLLPCYPLLFVLAGVLPEYLAPRLRWASLLLCLLAGAQAFEGIAHQPDQIAYFNVFAGGPKSGPKWLDDSNVDWGQDLGRLPRWLEARGIHKVRGAFLSRIDPAYYGLDWEPIATSDLVEGPRPGAYVVSAHVLARLLEKKEKEGWKSDWLYRYEPTDVLGASLFLYVFPQPVFPQPVLPQPVLPSD